MAKKLKLKIVKFERGLAMQVLEMEHLPKANSKIISPAFSICMYDNFITIGSGVVIDTKYFKSNAERDAYLQKVLGWITDELFGGGKGKLKAGETCEVSDDGKTWVMRIFAGNAPSFGRKDFPFLTNGNNDLHFVAWKYARPLSAQPTIDGDIYTWEGEE